MKAANVRLSEVAPFSVKADDVAGVIMWEVEHPSSAIAWVPPAMRTIA